MNPKYYFLSDAHLGSRVVSDQHAHEQRLVDWLDMAQNDATAIFLLGDIFDFWFEYATVVPKGFTRLLGKLREITESGIPVHFFVGNHDLWTFGYLEQEIGLIVHREPQIFILEDKRFFMAHGDGLGDNDRKFSLIRRIFHNHACQWAFRNLLPTTIGINFGQRWSENNRRRHERQNIGFLGEHREPLVLFAKQHSMQHPDIDYYIFGHRHIVLNLMLNGGSQVLILGDFIKEFTYATFDGKTMAIENFGETTHE
ncbi:MAG: UDP-2,3-diacylglucosamine diphosphatase [Paludibacteraceae bacterium]